MASEDTAMAQATEQQAAPAQEQQAAPATEQQAAPAQEQQAAPAQEQQAAPASEQQAVPASEQPAPRPPKRKSRADTLQRPKRNNTRMAVPPSIQVDHAFWTGLLASQRAQDREAQQARLTAFRIFG